ncbi:hypothetical protein, partial [Treponema pedis]|uniref:hypothetical protein n=1 Tax=Treponema pedis TaxID=409322 RepID=UPI001268B81E
MNFKRLINSISNIKKSPYVNSLSIYVLSNKEHIVEFTEEIKSFDLNIILDCDRDGVDSIAINRTILRKRIYEYFKDKDFITWILDDDLELYQRDYFEKIAYYKEQNKADLLFSLTTNEPPIPFLLTLRLNLLQYFFLKHNKDNNCKIVSQKILSEFYYDLTEDFKYLELPVGFTKQDQDVVLNRIKKGQSSYTIDFFASYFGDELPASRYNIVGGNCIILNKKFLL